MARIIIGSEYAEEFGSIYRLFSGGFISDEIRIKRASENVIETEKNTFVFSEREHGVNGGDAGGGALGFKKDGATWFSGLRGGYSDSGNADWKQLISDVAADFHKRYSLIEFKRTSSQRTDAEEERIKRRFASGFLERVFPEGKQYSLSNVRGTETENIYAVSMRLEINGGGESEPVLGKIYFRESKGSGLVPVFAREAGQLDGYINGAVPSDDEREESTDFIDAALVTRVFAALDRAFSGGKFAKYALFNDKYRKEIDEMLSQLATSEVKSLECTGVKVLGISHLEWESSAYDVYCRGKSVLKLVIGLNDSVTLFCTNCGGDVTLIDGNIIKFQGDPPENCRTVLDFGLDNLGLISEDIETIRKKGVLSEHLLEVRCAENPRNPRCSATVCLSQSVTVESGGKKSYKCKGCRYPEIIYSDLFGTGGSGKYTPALGFAADRLALVPEKTAKCPCCGREFLKSSLGRGGLCRFCAASPAAADELLYKKYSACLGVWVRLKHLFHKKYCRESDNIILFELGGDRYVLDKLDVKESGFIKSPVKYKGNGGGR